MKLRYNHERRLLKNVKIRETRLKFPIYDVNVSGNFIQEMALVAMAIYMLNQPAPSIGVLPSLQQTFLSSNFYSLWPITFTHPKARRSICVQAMFGEASVVVWGDEVANCGTYKVALGVAGPCGVHSYLTTTNGKREIELDGLIWLESFNIINGAKA